MDTVGSQAISQLEVRPLIFLQDPSTQHNAHPGCWGTCEGMSLYIQLLILYQQRAMCWQDLVLSFLQPIDGLIFYKYLFLPHLPKAI